jgi:hypothetical protein
MMLVFDQHDEHDLVVDAAPIPHDGGMLSFECAKATSNRFVAPLVWLTTLEASDFPAEFWNDRCIPAAFRKLGKVVEIDQDYLDGDYSSLWVVVARSKADGLPDDLWVANNSGFPGLGSPFGIRPLLT